ncbi:MAG: gluconokinase [Candidatus Binataceae bacterium]
MVVIVMGVAGVGKTTIGRMLAESLGWEFHDADDLHPEENRRKLHAGIALTDDDRRPWLVRVRELIENLLADGRDAVVACSALKQSYRDELVVDPASVKVVWLTGDFELVRRRIESRKDHFMNPALLKSQFATLEPPRDAIVVDTAASPAAMIDLIRANLRL